MRAGARDASLGPRYVCFLFYLFEYTNVYCQLSGMRVRPPPPASTLSAMDYESLSSPFHHTTALGIYFYFILLS
jgi:hypothetical protein